MTHRPHESWNIVDRPDLPEYELNKACPVTGEVTGLENHHISPRSAGTKSWWVELPDGSIVGNRINLSSSAHWRVTVNRARISCDEAANGRPVFYWEEAGEKTRLSWQPPAYVKGISDAIAHPDWLDKPCPVVNDGDRVYDTATGKTTTISEGEECPSCHRRVPYKKKQSSPQETKPLQFGRAPVDLSDELKDRLEDLAKTSGLSSSPYPQARAINLALTLAEGVQIETLADVVSEIPWGRYDKKKSNG